MTRSQKQLAILGVLIVVMIVVYAGALRPKGQPAAQPTDRVEGVQADEPSETSPGRAPDTHDPVIPPRERSPQRDAQRQYAGMLAWSRDPFTRGAEFGAMSGLLLTGILWDERQPVAIINDQTVQVGDTLDGYRVVDIDHDRVSFSDGTQTFELRITR